MNGKVDENVALLRSRLGSDSVHMRGSMQAWNAHYVGLRIMQLLVLPMQLLVVRAPNRTSIHEMERAVAAAVQEDDNRRALVLYMSRKEELRREDRLLPGLKHAELMEDHLSVGPRSLYDTRLDAASRRKACCPNRLAWDRPMVHRHAELFW